MQRVKHLYVRYKGVQIPVYSIETDADSAEMETLLKEGTASVLREFTQYGFEADITQEIIKLPEGIVSIMTVTPGGALKRTLKQRKARAK